MYRQYQSRVRRVSIAARRGMRSRKNVIQRVLLLTQYFRLEFALAVSYMYLPEEHIFKQTMYINIEATRLDKRLRP